MWRDTIYEAYDLMLVYCYCGQAYVSNITGQVAEKSSVRNSVPPIDQRLKRDNLTSSGNDREQRNIDSIPAWQSALILQMLTALSTASQPARVIPECI